MDCKPIPGFPHYLASEDGQIYSLYSNKFLKPRVCKQTGYAQLTLCENKVKHVKHVHRLVALAVVPNPDELPWINHKDENRVNNAAENLEWCTPSYNNSYGRKAEKQRKTVGIESLRESARAASKHRRRKVRCVETGEVYESTTEAARRVGLKSHTGITLACNGSYGTSAGYHWEYEGGA